MKPLVISFYSDVDGTDYYSRNAERLGKQLTALGVEHVIYKKESLGDYRSNCLSKPKWIMEKMIELDRPVIWLDVDSRVHKPLDAFGDVPSDVDVMFSSAMKEALQGPPGSWGWTTESIFDGTATQHAWVLQKLVSGMKASPLYFGNTDGAVSFLGEWIESTEVMLKEGALFDHEPLFVIFANAIREQKYNLDCVGIDYCTWPGGTNDSTVITMGLSDSETKKEQLRTTGMLEEIIEWQSGGDAEHDD